MTGDDLWVAQHMFNISMHERHNFSKIVADNVIYMEYLMRSQVIDVATFCLRLCASPCTDSLTGTVMHRAVLYLPL